MVFVLNHTGYAIIIYLLLLDFFRTKVDFLLFANALESTFIILHGCCRSVNLFWNRKKFHKVTNELKYFWKLEDFSDTVTGQYCLGLLRSNLNIFIFFVTSITASVIFCILMPFIIQEHVLIFNCCNPQSVPYFWLHILHNYVFIYIVITSAAYSIFLCGILILVHIQFKLLNERLGKLDFENASGLLSKENELLNTIKILVNYHDFLIQFVEHFNSLVSGALLVNFSVMNFAVCIELYKISLGLNSVDFCRSVFVAGGIVFDTVVLHCVPAQLLSDEATNVSNSIYSSTWYTSKSSEVKKSVQMIIMRGQKDLNITGGNLININLETGIITLKAIGTYYMWIRTVSE